MSVRSTVQKDLLAVGRAPHHAPPSGPSWAGERDGGGAVAGGVGSSSAKKAHTVLNLLWCMIGASLVKRLQRAGSKIERVSQLEAAALHWAA